VVNDGEDTTPISPTPAGIGARLQALLAARRGRVVTAFVGLTALLGACVVAINAGSSESAAPTTTTTTSTSTSTTTTTAPPPPPPVYPLTGLPAVDPAVAGRPTLIVKIDNVEPKSRPQIGLNQADIVYEERVEGAVTRFMAIFHSGDAVPVGPVRSARTSDIGLFRPMGTPLFAWSGANAIFAQRIREAGIVDIGYDAASGLYSRAGNREAPHNLMLNGTPDVWAAGYPGATAPPQLFSYRAPGEAPVGGRPTSGVHIVFGTEAGSAPVDYRWNGTGWARSQAGTPHLDAEGVQIAPENVIVSYTPYAASDTADQFGVPIREAQLVGEGEALVLTGGQAFAARWVKPALEAPTQYFDLAGAPIRLTPGRTWVALPEPGTTVFLP
jgi:Protein of unknown function (DUF3048) N-terminal domain/Protein of unknown function (DUF3048) C-terminal domain